MKTSMDKCILIKPDISFEDEIKAFRAEMLAAGSGMDGSGPLRRMETIREWLEFNQRSEKEETAPDDWVPSEQFIYVRERDNKIVGMIQFRHYFNEFLAEFGGNIGYSVRPDERRKGYAKRMLADCLAVCKQHGLDKVLITCDQENEGSKRTILANGGIHERTTYYETEDICIERYWIML
jgi:predicted acetyltransferase